MYPVVPSDSLALSHVHSSSGSRINSPNSMLAPKSKSFGAPSSSRPQGASPISAFGGRDSSLGGCAQGFVSFYSPFMQIAFLNILCFNILSLKSKLSNRSIPLYTHSASCPCPSPRATNKNSVVHLSTNHKVTLCLSFYFPG